MSKIKKISISILIALATVFALNTISVAYNVGDNVAITFRDYYYNKNVLCLEHRQNYGSIVYFTVKSHIKLEGTKSTDYLGNVQESWYNAKLAGILNSPRSKYYVQNSMWNFAYTWMENVGKYHAGLYSGFASTVHGANNILDQESTDYANSIENMESNQQIVDNTNKENIKVTPYISDNKALIKIGPFNWTFTSNLNDIEVYNQNNQKIENVLYSIYVGNEEKMVAKEQIISGKDFYIIIDGNNEVSKITKIKAKMQYQIKGADLWFLEAKNASNQNLMIYTPNPAEKEIETTLDYDIDITGNLKIIKVDEDNNIVKLKDVGFYIQNEQTQKYVKVNTNGQIEYVGKDQATEFVTDNNGEIQINGLIVGNYVAYESKNPNYGYEIIKDGIKTNVVIDKTQELNIPNKKAYIKLSGFVWQDRISSEKTSRDSLNSLYKDTEFDDGDRKVEGIKVTLKTTDGTVVKDINGKDCIQYTDNKGEYIFKDVPTDKLSSYYVEFEYDGLTFTNVEPPYLDKDNGSKAKENQNVREQQITAKFQEITGADSQTTGYSRDVNGNIANNLTYTIEDNKAILSNNGKYSVYKVNNQDVVKIEKVGDFAITANTRRNRI